MLVGFLLLAELPGQFLQLPPPTLELFPLLCELVSQLVQFLSTSLQVLGGLADVRGQLLLSGWLHISPPGRPGRSWVVRQKDHAREDLGGLFHSTRLLVQPADGE